MIKNSKKGEAGNEDATGEKEPGRIQWEEELVFPQAL